MNKKIRDALLASTLAVGAIAGGVAATAQGATAATTTEASTSASSSTTSSSTSDARPPGDRADREARMAERDAALAEKLGVTTAEVTAARTAAREAVDAELGEPERPAKPAEGSTERPELTDAQKAALAERHALFQEKFAEELGVSVDELKAAEVALAKEHLAQAVADGRITQEQADERLAAIEAGEVGPGFGPGPGGPGPR